MGPDLYKVQVVGDGFLAVMAKPVAGEWLVDDLRSLAQSGVVRVLSLLEPEEQRELGLAEEAAACEEAGLGYESYPIPDRGLPKSLEEFQSYARTLHDSIARGSSTVVHCRAGIGRSGMASAAVLLHAGFGADEALARTSQARGVDVPDTSAQRDFIFAMEEAIAREA